MATSSLSLTSLVVLAACTASAAAQGFLYAPVIHSTNTQYFAKRAVELPLTNRTDVAYYARLNFGTPAQSQYVQLDTGSFELWVNPTCASLGTSDSAFCKTVGTFDPSKSSTAKNLRQNKTLNYGIGSANISYYTDTIGLPGSASSMENVQFGVASVTKSEFAGILGIGYGKGITLKYNNFIDSLAINNVTKVKAYSLAIGSKDAKEGVIVFGGVDTSKFSGPLAGQAVIPAASSPDKVPRFWITMNGVSLSAPGASERTYANGNIPVFLDSGSTMTLLPETLASSIAADFGATKTDSNGFYPIDCSLADLNGTVNFAFNGTTIRVPYSEMTREVAGSPPSCFLGIQPSTSFTLLGDTFMRSAYTVVDLDANMVWLAQAAHCGSTPAAIADSAVLGTVKGKCHVTTEDTASNKASGDKASSSSSSTATAAGTSAATPRTSAATSKTSSAAASSATSSTNNTSAAPRLGMNAWAPLLAGLGTIMALGFGL